ncbi:TetR/AcrR family transcriptional regulator [Algicella marina]|uniref:TetR family transcriptional regulator n=1 Tax=Algicella marina TaxID=2683284 RepID=A0A6P1STI4_9RHOB|nr:TetR/AcrR family transcriptional regulator [Algicella marina]QHQ33994.1 TetR family transcriptional regulator [Algicella marina]
MSTRDKRAATREKLVEAATKRITDDGLASLRARDLAADVGCAVGSIYTIFKDLEALVLEVNSATFRDLGAHVTAAVKAQPADAYEAQLVAMGQAYAGFARLHPNRWSAVFNVEMSNAAAVPEWYNEQVKQLFMIIAVPLAALRRDLDEADVRLLTRGLFAGVHGIVLLSVEDRISAVPTDDVPRVIELLVGSAVHPPV